MLSSISFVISFDNVFMMLSAIVVLYRYVIFNIIRYIFLIMFFMMLSAIVVLYCHDIFQYHFYYTFT